MTVNPSRRIADVLVDRRLITTDDLTIVQDEADAAGVDVLERLVTSGRVRRIDALGALAERLEVTLFDPAIDFIPDPAVIGKLDAATALSEGALPISLRDDVLTVAVADPLDAAKHQRLRAAAHTEVRLAIAPEQELLSTVRRVYLAQPQANALDPDAPTPIVASGEAPAEAAYHVNDLLRTTPRRAEGHGLRHPLCAPARDVGGHSRVGRFSPGGGSGQVPSQRFLSTRIRGSGDARHSQSD
jgi:hypothetical protein